jgi:hypothetical protein
MQSNHVDGSDRIAAMRATKAQSWEQLAGDGRRLKIIEKIQTLME